MMNCPKARIHLSRLLDGDLNAREATALMAHLQNCFGCEAEYRSLLQTRETLKGLSSPACGSEAKKRVFSRFEAMASQKAASAKSNLARVRRWQASALATCASALMLALILQRLSGPEPVRTPHPDRETNELYLLHLMQADSVADGGMILHQGATAEAEAELFPPVPPEGSYD